MIKKTAFPATKVEINKPDLLRYRLATEDIIINISLVFKHLENSIYLGPGLLKNKILKCFQ